MYLPQFTFCWMICFVRFTRFQTTCASFPLKIFQRWIWPSVKICLLFSVQGHLPLLLEEKRQSHTGCICWTFLQCMFSNVSLSPCSCSVKRKDSRRSAKTGHYLQMSFFPPIFASIFLPLSTTILLLLYFVKNIFDLFVQNIRRIISRCPSSPSIFASIFLTKVFSYFTGYPPYSLFRIFSEYFWPFLQNILTPLFRIFSEYFWPFWPKVSFLSKHFSLLCVWPTHLGLFKFIQTQQILATRLEKQREIWKVGIHELGHPLSALMTSF